ncbi:MAG: single-stranded DNA-binding protein [Bacilli bacterium]|nr:single-stranded DNA-binding protein [Bacilli bacterium]
MLNNLILVGRIVDEVKITSIDSGQKVANFTLAVQRPFKNENDEYDTDFFPIQLWQGVADIAHDYCTKGSTVGIKGRIAAKTIDVQGTKAKTLDIIGERIAFINMKHEEEKE